ncbi:hypothetical protein HYX07_02740 [Candidatus Woesearchaeota archaeon]|nr:hypothetical protein [Candidatus Woesearchaeota archaeon]
MLDYKKAIITQYGKGPNGYHPVNGAPTIFVLGGIPALLQDRMDPFNQSLEAGYFEMMRMFGLNKVKSLDELGIKTRVGFRNELFPVAFSKRGSIIYRKKLLPYVMEVRAKIPLAHYVSEEPLQEWPNADLISVYFDALEEIVDAALTQKRA